MRAIAAGVVALAAAVVGTAVASAQPATGLQLTSLAANCGPSGVQGTLTVTNAGAVNYTGRVRFFLSARADGGAWERFGGEQFAPVFDTDGGTAIPINYGPFTVSGGPGGSAAVRVEAVLDAVTVDPAGSTIVIWDIASIASTTTCATATPTGTGGQTLYASGFGGTCGPASVIAQATLSNVASYPQNVKADIALAYADGGTWVRLPGAAQTYSTTIEPSGSVTMPANFSLTGMPADAEAVRLEVALTGVNFIAGQAHKTRDELTGTSIPCPAGEPVAGKEKYTVILGDSLARVASLHKVSPEDLAAANSLAADARLTLGQALVLPKTAVKPATTTTTGGPVTRGTVAPGEPSVRSTREPVAKPTKTATPEPTETETATPDDPSSTPVSAAVTSTTSGGGDSPAEPTDPEAEGSGGGINKLLLPIAIGVVIIAGAGGIAFGSVMLLRKMRSRGGGGASAPAPGSMAAMMANIPAQPGPALAVPAAKKPGTKEEPAAIPLSGDMRDLLGLERNRTHVAREFVPDPDNVAATAQILSEARNLARALEKAS